MKTTVYTFICAMALAGMANHAAAQTWRPKHAGLMDGLQAACVYGEGTMIMVGNGAAFQGEHIYYAPDSATHYVGTNVAPALSPPGMLTSIVKSNGSLFVGGAAGGVFKSADNGVNWSTAGAAGVYTFALYAHNDTLYANMGNTAQEPHFSTDGGATWQLIPNHPGTLITHFLKQNGVLYAAGASSLSYTSDNGANWTAVPSLGGGTANSYGLASFQGKVYTAASGGVFESADDGATWTNKTFIGSQSIVAVDTSLIVGTGGTGVFRSDKSASTWTQIADGLPIFIGTLYESITRIAANDQFIIASAQGSDSAIYIIGLSELGLKPDTSTSNPTAVPGIGGKQLSFAITPNPATTEVLIKLNAQAGAETHITLVDVNGRVLRRITVHQGGDLNMDLRAVPHGLYFVQAEQAGVRKTIKLIVQ